LIICFYLFFFFCLRTLQFFSVTNTQNEKSPPKTHP
jgi:hypothetical protein